MESLRGSRFLDGASCNDTDVRVAFTTVRLPCPIVPNQRETTFKLR